MQDWLYELKIDVHYGFKEVSTSEPHHLKYKAPYYLFDRSSISESSELNTSDKFPESFEISANPASSLVRFAISNKGKEMRRREEIYRF